MHSAVSMSGPIYPRDLTYMIDGDPSSGAPEPTLEVLYLSIQGMLELVAFLRFPESERGRTVRCLLPQKEAAALGPKTAPCTTSRTWNFSGGMMTRIPSSNLGSPLWSSARSGTASVFSRRRVRPRAGPTTPFTHMAGAFNTRRGM